MNNLSEKDIIKKIAAYCQKVYPQKKILPSLVIAQCICETGHFSSKLFTQAYNLTGMKWTSGCGCDYITFPTKEWNGSKYITINARFRKYKTLEDGIAGHYEFLTYPRYSNLKGVTDYKKACQLIKDDGWATSPVYTNTLISIIESYNLTQYDGNYSKPSGVKEWQHAMNVGFDTTELDEDGIWGSQCESFAKNHILKYNIKGHPTAVKWLQKKLGISADGIFGKNTKNAVIKFQKNHGLDTDGIVGLKTYKKLLSV